MAQSGSFAYNPTGIQIPGSAQFLNLAVGEPTTGYTQNPPFWSGPDKSLGYVIAKTVPGGKPSAVPGETAYVGFWRSKLLTTESFLQLAEFVGQQPFASPEAANTWLNDNGYWSSFETGGCSSRIALPQGNGSVVFNGITITSVASGNVFPGNGATMACLNGAPYGENGPNLGFANIGGTFSYVLTFSQPLSTVNLSFQYHHENENFTITTNGGNPTIVSLDSCCSTIIGNQILGTTCVNPNFYPGSGIYSITPPSCFTTLTITGTSVYETAGSVVNLCNPVVCGVTPTPTTTQTPTNTPTQTPSGTPTGTPTETPTNTPTQSQTPSETPTQTPTNSQTPTYTSTPTPTPTTTPISEYDCGQSFSILVNQPGMTNLNVVYDMLQNYGNSEIFMSASTFNAINEVFVGLAPYYGEVFQFNYGVQSATKTVGLYSSNENSVLNISVFTNGTTSQPFRPFTLFFSAACPTVFECPINPTLVPLDVSTSGFANENCTSQPTNVKYGLYIDFGYGNQLVRLFNDSAGDNPFDGNDLWWTIVGVETIESYKVDDDGMIRQIGCLL